MAMAWVFQDDKHVKKVGPEKASYYVGWIDPDGKRCCKSCGPGEQGERNALKLKKKTEAELLTGTYQIAAKIAWKDFRSEYEAKIVTGMGHGSRHVTLEALNHFERLIKPKRVAPIKTHTIDDYVARRRLEPGKKKGDTVSPASINKELRHLRAALHIALEWKYLPAMPRVRMLREPGKLPTYVIPDHFAMIYGACEHARLPNDLPGITAADWWRGLMVMGYMTGWRISDMLGLDRDDLDLDAGTAITRWEDNKGKRDEKVKLHPVVVEHLRKLASFDPHVFPWNPSRRTLDKEFARIQEKAGIHLPCRKKHEHTPACHVYGFHDLRRAFATMNADRLTPDALQALMRHKSYQTTQRYINMARQLDEAVASLHVPEVLNHSERA
jgi:integrase